MYIKEIYVGVMRPPKGYTDGNFPQLGGQIGSGEEECCPHCLCVPCVIAMPPAFLTGSAAPALGNMTKRFALYRKFWQLLKELGLWQHDTYLQRKGARTARDDPREIIPHCIVTVRNMSTYVYVVVVRMVASIL